MITLTQLLLWGERWHYPALVLDDGQRLLHGRAHYAKANYETQKLIAKRISQASDPVMRVLPLAYIREFETRKARQKRRRYASGIA